MQKETSNITIRVPMNRQQQIDSIARQSDRSRNWVINQAITEYLALHAPEQHPLTECKNGQRITEDTEIAPTLMPGEALVAYWKEHGVVGSRAEIGNSQAHARKLRKEAETRSG